METVITNDDRIAMAEVDYVLHHMNERYLNKIPQNVRDFIDVLKKSNRQIYVDPKVPLEKQNLKEFTLYFLMILNLKYWCNDERRKEILLMLERNQKKFDDKINNIFEQADSIQGDVGVNTENNREYNKPKQVIITGSTNSTTNEIQKEALDKNNSSTQKVENQNNNNDVFEQLQEETGTILAQAKKESFFKRIINKIKTILVKK
ncbi:MAG: hypothetical protein HFJ45_08680 [Clostridia bacterium]|nr:hypothetical protein [Clostridia bacterium]